MDGSHCAVQPGDLYTVRHGNWQRGGSQPGRIVQFTFEPVRKRQHYSDFCDWRGNDESCRGHRLGHWQSACATGSFGQRHDWRANGGSPIGHDGTGRSCRRVAGELYRADWLVDGPAASGAQGGNGVEPSGCFCFGSVGCGGPRQQVEPPALALALKIS